MEDVVMGCNPMLFHRTAREFVALVVFGVIISWTSEEIRRPALMMFKQPSWPSRSSRFLAA